MPPQKNFTELSASPQFSIDTAKKARYTLSISRCQGTASQPSQPATRTTAMHQAFQDYANNILTDRYSHIVSGRKESWPAIAERVVKHVIPHDLIPFDITQDIQNMITQRKFIPGGRILSQAGRQYHQTDNCYCLRAEDTREGWANLAHKCTMMFMSGGGVGIDYSDIRPRGQTLQRSGGISSGPIPLLQMINCIGAAARQGGDRRGAIYGSLVWDHLDIQEFIQLKSHTDLRHTNISVRFDNRWLKDQAYTYPVNSNSPLSVFYDTLKHACQYGDPGFQFDTDDQILRNACTEIISADDGDSCCLGSLNFAQITDIKELAEVTQLAVLFLLCNTLYTDTPTQQVADVKAKNRRIGLGIMGIGEWFLQRDISYGYVPEAFTGLIDTQVLAGWPSNYNISQWLQTYAVNADNAAIHWSNKLSVNKPVATRAIAPTGTISIAAGHTTPGIEPLFSTSYIRKYNTPQGLKEETVIYPIVMKLHEQGFNIDNIDTAYRISETVEGIERRIAFQAYCQQFVDNAISGTVNLSSYEEGIEEKIAPILLKYLPKLRGITFYPNGAHNNQPVTPIPFQEALQKQPILQEGESCKGGNCGL